jgi:ribosomal protein S18 acetylase RimI-like enzyme
VVRGSFALVGAAEDAAVDAVYRAAFADEAGGASPDFLDRELRVHRDREGFSFVGAVDGGELIGFVYGVTGRRGQWWSDHVALHAPVELVDVWVGGHFEVVELAVLPEARGRGVGAALMIALLEDRPEPCALLATWQHDSPSRRLYERLGWIELLHDLAGDRSLYGRLLR